MKQWAKPMIIVLASGLIVGVTAVDNAEPVGTAFTYQGRLIDANTPADGLYDLYFTLYDGPREANQIGYTIEMESLDVIDGYFTLKLDFGPDPDVFNGQRRWIEIGIRSGHDPNDGPYDVLSPRQEIRPAPYALHSLSAPSVSAPLIVNGAESGPVISATNAGTGSGIQGETSSEVRGSAGVEGVASGEDGYGVYGHASNTNGQNYGGFFEAGGNNGTGVSGRGSHCGGEFEADGETGIGVRGYSKNPQGLRNRGGYFEAAGREARGLEVWTIGEDSRGVASNVSGEAMCAIYGRANDRDAEFGGHFVTEGNSGCAVYGEATSSSQYPHYGGMFIANKGQGEAIYAEGSRYSGHFWGDILVQNGDVHLEHGSVRVEAGDVRVDQGKLTVGVIESPADSIQIKAGTTVITVSPTGKVTIDTNSDIDLQATNINMTAAANITMAAGGNINMTAGGNISQDGSEVGIKASVLDADTSQTKIKGAATVDIDGGLITLN